MSSTLLAISTALSLAFLTSAHVDADDKPLPSPAPTPAPGPAPAPGDKPAEKPTGMPAEKVAERGYPGFVAAPAAALSAKQKKHWGVKATTGIVVIRVVKESPAGVAGLRNGDVLLKCAGKDVPAFKDEDATNDQKVQAFQIAFSASVGQSVKDGDVVEIVVEREGKPVTLKAIAIGRDALRKINAAADGDEEDEGDEGAEGPETGEKPSKPTDKPAGDKPAEPAKPAEPEPKKVDAK